MRPNLDAHVKVPRRRSPLSCLARVLNFDKLAVLDARQNFHAYFALRSNAASALARGARLVRHLARAAALLTRAYLRETSEKSSSVLFDFSLAIARGARRKSRLRFNALPLACFTPHECFDL